MVSGNWSEVPENELIRFKIVLDGGEVVGQYVEALTKDPDVYSSSLTRTTVVNRWEVTVEYAVSNLWKHQEEIAQRLRELQSPKDPPA